ncbi:MAG: pyridine nucleotide-disulfide oxidoreductase, partial [Lachnospiraceae bacterium]|nr:pyridine nucleotide-disulfide oxidoreductase [Lachnospiraceae bacterium]
LETSIPGVFAAGNVLHVHDLVDYVSEEAGDAGRNAAMYVRNGEQSETRKGTPVAFAGGIRYTVPAAVDPEQMKDLMTVRFRVGAVMKDRIVRVYANGTEIFKKKRRIMAPGEMEEVLLKKADLLKALPLETLEIRIEEA